jgi:hypothetical protein
MIWHSLWGIVVSPGHSSPTPPSKIILFALLEENVGKQVRWYIQNNVIILRREENRKIIFKIKEALTGVTIVVELNDDDIGRDIEIDSSVCCCGHGDLDSISTNGVLLVCLSEGSNDSDDDDEDGNFDDDEGAVGVNTDVMLGLLEDEDMNGRKAGCVDVNGRSLLVTKDIVCLEDVSGGGLDKTPVSDEEDDGSEVCEILDLHTSPKSFDASLLPKLLPSMTSLSS